MTVAPARDFARNFVDLWITGCSCGQEFLPGPEFA